MAPLGKPKRRIRVEPLPEPTRRDPAPSPRPDRETAPTEPKRRDKVPA
jgi:hypothetical protein